VLLSAQGMAAGRIAEVAFTSEDRVGVSRQVCKPRVTQDRPL